MFLEKIEIAEILFRDERTLLCCKDSISGDGPVYDCAFPQTWLALLPRFKSPFHYFPKKIYLLLHYVVSKFFKVIIVAMGDSAVTH